MDNHLEMIVSTGVHILVVLIQICVLVDVGMRRGWCENDGGCTERVYAGDGRGQVQVATRRVGVVACSGSFSLTTSITTAAQLWFHLYIQIEWLQESLP